MKPTFFSFEILKKIFQAFVSYVKGIGIWRYLLYVLLTFLASAAAMGLIYLDVTLFAAGKIVLGVLTSIVTIIYLSMPLVLWHRNSRKTE